MITLLNNLQTTEIELLNYTIYAELVLINCFDDEI